MSEDKQHVTVCLDDLTLLEYHHLSMALVDRLRQLREERDALPPLTKRNGPNAERREALYAGIKTVETLLRRVVDA